MNRYTCYLLFGSPGAGKGTQGKALGTIPGFYHCACGDVFRALDLRTPLGHQFAEFSSKGLLVPDELTIQLWQTTIDAQVSGPLESIERDHPRHLGSDTKDSMRMRALKAPFSESILDVHRAATTAESAEVSVTNRRSPFYERNTQ
jgi:hypothetical protein